MSESETITEGYGRAIQSDNSSDTNGHGRYIKTYDNIEARFCKCCKPEAIMIRNKYNQRICRLKKARRVLKEFGGVALIQQRMDFNQQAHKIIKNLKDNLRYYKNVCNRRTNAMSEV